MVATTTPIWAQNLRDAGRQHFEVLGLPSTKAEPWRYFPTRAISKIAWASGGTAEGAGHGSLDQGALAAFALDDMAATVVLVDGRFSADLSSATTLPEGLVVTSLRAAIARDDAALRGVLGQVVDAEVDGLVAANQAQFADGVFVSVAKNVQVEAPLYVLSVTTQGSDETAISMRNVVSLGQSSSLTFAVRHVVLAGAMEKTKYVTNIVTEVQLAANAGLTHIKLEDEG
ncbi:MAG: Fe-S cluster assembly protein SufD, partial [Myxococcota bacterium]